MELQNTDPGGAARSGGADPVHMLVDSVDDSAMCVLNPNGLLLTWNRGAERLTGFRAEEIVGRHFSTFYPEAEVAAGRPEHDLQDAATAGRIESESWRMAKGGRCFWAKVALTALRDDQGTLHGFGHVLSDLGDAREREDALHHAVNSAIDGIVTIDASGTVLSFSRGAELMFGCSSGDICGRNVAALMPEPERGAHDGHLRRYLDSGDKHVIGIGREVQCQRRDGSLFAAELAVSEFRVGEQRQFLGVLRDVTERKRVDAQMQQAQRMEAFGRLAGGIAHDFNNLLTVILGNVEHVMASLPKQHAGYPALRMVHDAGEQAAALTRRLLTFSRHSEFKAEVLDLNQIVADADGMLRQMIGDHIVMTAVLDPDIARVRVDKTQMQQVLLNLAVNARDAMLQGGRFTVRTMAVEVHSPPAAGEPSIAPGPYVLLSVSDTGHGITAAVRGRIFEPFFTTRQRGGSSGLGLTIVLDIVEKAGGYIEVDSVPGAGATFWIYLPAAGEASEPASPPRSLMGSEHVLVLEDNEAVRAVAERGLTQYGYRVLVARDGAEALEIAARPETRIDLLVTDVVMPKMSGRQVTDEMRRARPGLRVLFVSGYDQDLVVQHGVEQRDVAFLAKPFAPHELAAKVRDVLDQ